MDKTERVLAQNRQLLGLEINSQAWELETGEVFSRFKSYTTSIPLQALPIGWDRGAYPTGPHQDLLDLNLGSKLQKVGHLVAKIGQGFPLERETPARS